MAEMRGFFAGATADFRVCSRHAGGGLPHHLPAESDYLLGGSSSGQEADVFALVETSFFPAAAENQDRDRGKP